ncbi:hypothetical protein LCGC14_2848330, partial [marine sediment metagenome]
ITLLRAEADLASHSQIHPTDTKGIRLKRRLRGQASMAWIRAGCPDLPDDHGRPVAIEPVERAIPKGDKIEDWEPTKLILRVLTVTDSGGLLMTDDLSEGWAPAKLVKDEYGGVIGTGLKVDDIEEVFVPADLARKNGWV